MKIKKAIGYTLAAAILTFIVYVYSTMPWYAIFMAIAGAVITSGTLLIVAWLLMEREEGDDDMP